MTTSSSSSNSNICTLVETDKKCHKQFYDVIMQACFALTLLRGRNEINPKLLWFQLEKPFETKISGEVRRRSSEDIQYLL